MAGENWEARCAVGEKELHDAQEAGVEGEALGEVEFAVAAEDAAAVGGERDARGVGEGSRATGSALVELREVAGFSEQFDLEGEEGLFESNSGECLETILQVVEEVGVGVVLFDQ